jgi:hypothetical protein
MKNRIFVSRPCPSAEDWQALLAGNLPTSRIEEIEAHLDGCLVYVARLDALTPSLPEELWDAARAWLGEPAPTSTWLPNSGKTTLRVRANWPTPTVERMSTAWELFSMNSSPGAPPSSGARTATRPVAGSVSTSRLRLVPYARQSHAIWNRFACAASVSAP